MTDQLFAQPSELGSVRNEPKRFGNRYNGRYHMPLLLGESGTASGGNWVPRDIQSTTNFVGALEDTRALAVWESAQTLAGLAVRPDLYERAVMCVQKARQNGVRFDRLREHPEVLEELVGGYFDQAKQDASIAGRAREAIGASIAAELGTNRHTAWEWRGAGRDYIGTPEMIEQTKRTEALLADAGLVRIGLSERVVRNVTYGTAGRFDDVLMRESDGRLFMGDLKSRVGEFFSAMTLDAQLANYASAEWMLTEDGQGYEPGPLHHVDQSVGVIMHVPSDGGPASLEQVDLENGRRACALARQIIDLRAYSRSAERMRRLPWGS